MRWMLLVMVGLCCCGGCATYEFDIVRPENLARHIDSKSDALVSIPPLDYRMRAVENRLVMSIFNTSGEAVQLLGSKSSIVDPGGQSHPLRDQSIAPSSFIKLILPPFRPAPPPESPVIGIGIGGSLSDADEPGQLRNRAVGYGTPADTTPRLTDVSDDSSVYYWEWDGQSDVRINLVFQRGDHTFQHSFVIRRKKV